VLEGAGFINNLKLELTPNFIKFIRFDENNRFTAVLEKSGDKVLLSGSKWEQVYHPHQKHLE